MSEDLKNKSAILGLFSATLCILFVSWIRDVSISGLLNNITGNIDIILLGMILWVLASYTLFPVIGKVFNVQTLQTSFMIDSKKPKTLIYYINGFLITAEATLLFFFALTDNTFWVVFFILSLIHTLIFFKYFGLYFRNKI